MSVTSLGSSGSAMPAEPPAGQPGAAADVQPAAQADPISPTELRVVSNVVAVPRGVSPLVPVVFGIVAALAVALVANRILAACACAIAWGLVAAVQSALHRRVVAIRAYIRDDLRTGLALVSVLCVASVTGLVSVRDARWGIAVVAAATLATAATRVLQPRRSMTQRVVVVGGQADVETYISAVRGTAITVAGCHVVDAGQGLGGQSNGGLPTTTSLELVPELVSAVSPDLVLVLPGRDTDADVVRSLTWMLEHHPVKVGVVTPVSSVAAHRLRATHVGNHAILELGAVGVSTLEARVKTVIDRVGAAALLALVSPLLLFLVLAVRLDSKGPGLFVQTRVGLQGELFRMFKLRTMFTDAESMKQALLEDNESDGVLFKIRRDPRVTRFGYWLRRSSLDELPQLLNVLRGEMSLVGPRPALPSEVAAYDEQARRRLVVKPGITGLWQVSGRSDLQWDESLRLDLYYADNWRLIDDFAIAARTVTAVTMARGAY
jgi:exopolysaccharide biosynthesis polyprenyl glycosylphosphotransferase